MRVTKSENGIKNKKNTKILANKTKKHIKTNLVFYDICFLCQRCPPRIGALFVPRVFALPPFVFIDPCLRGRQKESQGA
jgi:hypothetical protein